MCLKVTSPCAHLGLILKIKSVLKSNHELIEHLDITADHSVLNLGSIGFPNLKALHLDIDELHVHLNLIQSCRTSLERIRLRSSYNTNCHQVIISSHSCRELHTIDLKDDWEDENIPDEELLNLLIPHGLMLEYALWSH